METFNKRNEKTPFKIVVLGEAGVGKSSLIRRYTQGYFSPRTTTTVGVDRIPINITVDCEILNFQVLDTAGCFGFRGLIKSYMNNIDAVVFVYDLTNKESFACLPLWNTLLKTAGKRDITKVLVGNKRDLEEQREVIFRNAKNYAEFEGMVAMEISVKKEESVDLVFQCIARELKLKRQIADQEAKNKQPSSKKGRFSRNQSSMDLIQEDSVEELKGKSFLTKLSMMVLGKKHSNNKKGSFTPALRRKEYPLNQNIRSKEMDRYG